MRLGLNLWSYDLFCIFLSFLVILLPFMKQHFFFNFFLVLHFIIYIDILIMPLLFFFYNFFQDFTHSFLTLHFASKYTHSMSCMVAYNILPFPPLIHCITLLHILQLTYIIVKWLSHFQLFATPWTVAYQAPPSMGFSRQLYWSELPFPSPGDLPNTGIKPWVSCKAGRYFTL